MKEARRRIVKNDFAPWKKDFLFLMEHNKKINNRDL
jgi:hypothetical protein